MGGALLVLSGLLVGFAVAASKRKPRRLRADTDPISQKTPPFVPPTSGAKMFPPTRPPSQPSRGPALPPDIRQLPVVGPIGTAPPVMGYLPPMEQYQLHVYAVQQWIADPRVPGGNEWAYVNEQPQGPFWATEQQVAEMVAPKIMTPPLPYRYVRIWVYRPDQNKWDYVDRMNFAA